MNIVFKLTAAEAPFSNGLVQIYNLIFADMLDNVPEELNTDINLALSWWRNAIPTGSETKSKISLNFYW